MLYAPCSQLASAEKKIMSIQFSLYRFHYEIIFLAHFSPAATDDEAWQTGKEWMAGWMGRKGSEAKLKKENQHRTEKSQFVFTEK